jgi:peptide/nickel transport system ATP-binding protein
LRRKLLPTCLSLPFSASSLVAVSQPILSVRNLTIDFSSHRGDTRAVENISFDLRRGETLAIVGESGSGKSVTSLALMGLIPLPPGRITSGEARFQSEALGEVDLLKLTEEQLQRVRGNDIGMIFQEPMTSLNPVYTCGSQVVEALRLHTTLNAKEAEARTVELFRMAQLPRPEKIFSSYPHEISGGQKQRVMIAMAMACNPAILIADEPTTALDVTVQARMLHLIDDLRRQHNTAVIFITHDLGVVAEIADRIMVMYRGRVVEQGPVLDIFTNPQHPYTKGLLACRPKLSVGKKRLPVVADFMRETADGGFIATETAPTQLVANEIGEQAGFTSHNDIETTKTFPVEHPVSRPEAPHFGLETAPGLESGQPLLEVPNVGVDAVSEIYVPITVASEPAVPYEVVEAPTEPVAGARPLLEVRDLNVHFPIRKGFFNRTTEYVRAVDGVSFDIYPGETVGLVGESGCGKSTLAKAVCGLVPPDSGTRPRWAVRSCDWWNQPRAVFCSKGWIWPSSQPGSSAAAAASFR